MKHAHTRVYYIYVCVCIICIVRFIFEYIVLSSSILVRRGWPGTSFAVLPFYTHKMEILENVAKISSYYLGYDAIFRLW